MNQIKEAEGEGGGSLFKGPEVERKRIYQQREVLHFGSMKQKSPDTGKLPEIYRTFRESIPSAAAAGAELS